MLDFIYYPISAVLWFWREVLTKLGMPHDGGLTWALAIILLTATVKAILLYPTIRSLRSTRKMQELQPKMQEIRQRYKNDKQKQAEETQKLYKESGFNPIAGCLPMLVQIPVFIGMFHVIRSFNRTGEQFGGLGLTAEENRQIGNYFFSAQDVQSFLDARIFGVPLSTSIGMPAEQYSAFQPVDFARLDIALVAVPLIAATVIFTHLNARYTLNRQKARIASGKQAAPSGDNAEMMQMQQDMMGKMMLWFIPAMTIFTGYLWPIGLLFYFFTNTFWTFIQTRLVYAKMDKEEDEEIARRRESAQATAPAPGARTVDRRSKKQRKLDNQRSGSTNASQVIADDSDKVSDASNPSTAVTPVDRKAAEKARTKAKKKKKK
ncbi:membrane protein insertase YidC [Corynebacterium tapiri]|uniref:Membrane protein insertase YidC n=1 Tax=Corynebacterium tapiri TaxID=1448266 RepID=A0A5C4U4F0_9CORY|nr:membrane protein insertase YidC [Corynebacterium tapiri]TNL96860.1 membrane protein insertase YidC [Corynebacterium tapiri]